MEKRKAVRPWLTAVIIVVAAQETASGQAKPEADSPATDRSVYAQRVADGQRHGWPLETYAVVPGTRFLVSLEEEVNTKFTRQNQAFRVRTLEPLEAGHGYYLPSGAVIGGHVSRVQPAGTTGRAKIWLTFDEIHTPFGKLPIVAEVLSVPGDHSIKSGPLGDGAIEGRSSTQREAAESAAAAAAMGAWKGVKDRNKKEAAGNAALGALEAYLFETGRGQDLDLPKGAKLELELGRTLYLVRE